LVTSSWAATNWNLRVLHQFGSGTDGSSPWATLVFDAAGNLYGTTENGGIYSAGTVFELSPTQGGGGWTEKVLHNFNGTDGGSPLSNVTFDAAGNLYGTTVEGGVYGHGIVFELTPADDGNWAETVLYSFGPAPDGDEPDAGLTFDAAGNLYGTTFRGGTYDEGTLFELSPHGNGSWTETVVHSFGNGADGTYPYFGSLIFDAAGNLYGITAGGGNAREGTVFEFSPDGDGDWTETVLHSFDNPADGNTPLAGLTFDAAGNLYGTTSGAGIYGYGTVFELSPVRPCIACSHAGLR
jgi:uncharacterized repeat protein (TIGR03803 family)